MEVIHACCCVNNILKIQDYVTNRNINILSIQGGREVWVCTCTAHHVHMHTAGRQYTRKNIRYIWYIMFNRFGSIGNKGLKSVSVTIAYMTPCTNQLHLSIIILNVENLVSLLF